MTIDPARTRSSARAPRTRSASSGGPDRAASGEPARRLILVAEETASRWPLGRIIGAGMLAVGIVLIAAIVVGAVMLNDLSRDRSEVVNTIDPAASTARSCTPPC